MNRWPVPSPHAPRGMGERRPRLPRALGWAAFLAIAFVVSLVQASEVLRIRVQRPLHDDPLIEAAVVRVIGELGALGFDVEVLRRKTPISELHSPPPLDPGTEGALVFARDEGRVLVSAWVSADRRAFVQSFDVADPATSAEVVAVRAVEALRGLLLDPGSPPAPAAPSPAPGTASEPPAAPDPLAPAKPPDADDPSSPGSVTDPAFGTRWHVTGLVAPSVGLEALRLGTFGVGGTLVVGRGPVGAGVGGEHVVWSSPIRDDAGSATVGRQSLLGRLRTQWELRRAWEAFLDVGAGVARYSVTAQAEGGFTAADREHTAFAAGFALGSAYWLHPNAGLFISADAHFLPTPIRVLMEGRAVARLGAPAGALSLGLGARYR